MEYKRVLRKVLIFLICLEFLIGFYFSWSYMDFSKLGNKSQNMEYASYAHAVGLAIVDVDEALSLCSESSEMQGECFMNVARIVSEEDFNKGLDICNGINDVGWRSECFFVVAESLFDKNFSLASEICEKSEIFKYNCYHHLGSFFEDFFDNIFFAVLACNDIPIESRSSCFTGLGNAIGKRFIGDVPASVSACKLVPLEFRSSCFFGLGNFFGNHFSETISSSVLACNEVPVEFKDDCFFGLSNSFRRFGSNVSSIMSVCNKMPVEFRSYCSRDAGSSFSQLFGYDINSAISACNEFPFEFRPFCLLSLSSDKGRIGDASLCNKFENPYDIICSLSFGKTEGITFSKEKTVQCGNIADETLKLQCYRGFGRGLGERFLDNISLAFDICNSSLSNEYKFDCYKGVSEGIGNFFSETNSVFVLEQCSSLGKLSPYCFERVGRKIVGLYSYNLSEAFNTCYRVNKSFGDSCFTGLGKGLGEQFLSNLSLAQMKCDGLPNPYNIFCNQGIEYIIKFY